MAAACPILIMTRPRDRAEEFVAGLRQAGAPSFETLFAPLFDIRFTAALPDMTGIHGLIFTSVNGVRAYQAAGGVRVDQAAGGARGGHGDGVLRTGPGGGGPERLPAWCVGAATAQAAQGAGLTAQSADGDADALVSWLRDRKPAAPLLHIHGTHTRGDVAGRLTAAGIETRAAALYDQTGRALTPEATRALAGSRPVVLPLFSPRSARLLAELAERDVQAPLFIAAMSDAVDRAARPLKALCRAVATDPDAQALGVAVVEMLQKATALEGQRPEV